jgi:hypothetical protein
VVVSLPWLTGGGARVYPHNDFSCKRARCTMQPSIPLYRRLLSMTLTLLGVALLVEAAPGQPPRPPFPRPPRPAFPPPPGVRPGLPGSSFPGRPSSPFDRGGRAEESVWYCGNCKATLGTGPIKPTMLSCPHCGVHFTNGLTPEVHLPGFGPGLTPGRVNPPAPPRPASRPREQPPRGNAASKMPSPGASGPAARTAGSSTKKGPLIALAVVILGGGFLLLAGGAAVLVIVSQQGKKGKARKSGRKRRYEEDEEYD